MGTIPKTDLTYKDDSSYSISILMARLYLSICLALAVFVVVSSESDRVKWKNMTRGERRVFVEECIENRDHHPGCAKLYKRFHKLMDNGKLEKMCKDKPKRPICLMYDEWEFIDEEEDNDGIEGEE